MAVLSQQKTTKIGKLAIQWHLGIRKMFNMFTLLTFASSKIIKKLIYFPLEVCSGYRTYYLPFSGHKPTNCWLCPHLVAVYFVFKWP